MKLPSLTHRTEPAYEGDGDGRIGGSGGATTPTATEAPRLTDHEPRPAATGDTTAGRAFEPDRGRRSGSVATSPDATRPTAGPAGAGRDAVLPTPRAGVDNRTEADARPEPQPAAPVGPKPRASLLATLGLVVGIAGLATVLTGALAGYGIAVGALGAVLSVFGLLATRRRHVAGKTDALLGMAFGVAAVVLGVLAMTGQFGWPTTDGDWVQRLREWLDSQFVDRL
ncbi:MULTISPECIES: hypothetical protein [unclassified Micromonospora]|uniref:hypothetical protein n=1 Tax=unclassified Micromonospora TaxID=2617518 RepID=UPI003639758C